MKLGTDGHPSGKLFVQRFHTHNDRRAEAAREMRKSIAKRAKPFQEKGKAKKVLFERRLQYAQGEQTARMRIRMPRRKE